MIMITTLFGVGVFGVLGISVLCPLLAITVYYYRSRNSGKDPSPEASLPSLPAFIEIILPAHNEAPLSGAAVARRQRSVQPLQADSRVNPTPKVIIHVGADGCTDPTPQLARLFEQVHVTEFRHKQTKWVTLKALLADSASDWVLLVDVGTVWPESFL